MKTDKEREIRKLTWKYFRKQKWKEIKESLEDFYPIILIGMIIIGMLFQIGWVPFFEGGNPCSITLAIIGLCMIGFWIVIGLICLIKSFVKWLISNWRVAKKKARIEINGK